MYGSGKSGRQVLNACFVYLHKKKTICENVKLAQTYIKRPKSKK